MRWKIFAIFCVLLYVNALLYWFGGGYSPTFLHYCMLIFEIPLLVSTFCYAFNLDFGSVQTWRLSLCGLGLLLITKIIEDIGQLARVYEIAPHFTAGALAKASAIILFVDIFDLVVLSVQGVALVRYIWRLRVREPSAKPRHLAQPSNPTLWVGALEAKRPRFGPGAGGIQ